MSMKLLCIISVGSVIIDLLHIRFSTLGFDLNEIHQLLVYFGINLLGNNKNTTKENKETLLEASRNVGL
jgi:hypothetical protein